LLNLDLPTLGGRQFWTDHVWQQDWRVQQNALTEHWRLLDDKNVRRAWGTRSDCEKVLADRSLARAVRGDHLVILLHGLMRSSVSMQGLKSFLAEQPGYQVAAIDYASSRATIAEHAEALRDVVAHLSPDVQLSFVGHSMGNIVVRHALGDWQRLNDQPTLQRVRAVVMIGPPNQGAAIARQLAKTGMFGMVVGAGGMELGPGWEEFESQLAIPNCPFGIIAGRLPADSLKNPLVPGESDFVVSVEETRLEGADDFLEVPRLHSFLMDDATVQAAVANFLEHQKFQ
jgi:triacylglycerol esterase/lipase EstA (alpha/beta hydrolase family)